MWKVFVVAVASMLFSSSSLAQDNAVVLVYHHVSTDTPKSTSVSPQTFEQHMQYLAKHHTVLPLKTVVEKLKAKQGLPDKAVVITFDDGYKNIYENAHPILQKYQFPYTVFVNPPLIGKERYQLDWQQVNTMSKQGVTFANHGNEHIHSLQKQPAENQSEWLVRVVENVTLAEQLLTDKLGYSLKYFAYPYGEYSQEYKQALVKLGYIGFAQHSGAMASYSDFGALPRFPAAGIYGNLKTLKVKLNSLAMPAINLAPKDPAIGRDRDSLTFGFDITGNDVSPAQINCFKRGNKLSHEVDGKSILMQVQGLTRAGRHRVNCTAPSKQHLGRYYWLSQVAFVPTESGTWLD